mmetsp:Transcript_9797/g.24868  ORF Transcript_9797/g.24868 Transcript_9797/m.24868 type:complete len:217 (+) Transcript_9797:2278-2928(+)
MPAAASTSSNADSSPSLSAYSPTTHKATASTEDDLISCKLAISLCNIPERNGSYCSTIARTNIMTSIAPSTLRNSIRVCTMVLVTSGNFIAQACTEWMSIARYSPPFSKSDSFVRKISRLRTCMTSSMFLGDTRSIAICNVRLQMSIFGDVNALIRSIRTSVRVRASRSLISANRSRTINLTLLSDCDVSKVVYVMAAALTAVGDVDRPTSVHAAS